jgi:acyl carrier protein
MNKTLSDQELLLDLETAICNVLRVSGPGINRNTRLIGDLGAGSIDLFDLSCDLKKIAGAEVDFTKLFRQKRAQSDGAPLDVTLQEIVDYLKAQARPQEPRKIFIQ